jgi:hypothetical protein
VVREGDQLIIDSQGTIEINGMKEPMEGIQENPIVMNETAPVIPSQTSDMEVIDAVNSMPIHHLDTLLPHRYSAHFVNCHLVKVLMVEASFHFQ